jgi:hypothetical protein
MTSCDTCFASLPAEDPHPDGGGTPVRGRGRVHGRGAGRLAGALEDLSAPKIGGDLVLAFCLEHLEHREFEHDWLPLLRFVVADATL